MRRISSPVADMKAPCVNYAVARSRKRRPQPAYYSLFNRRADLAKGDRARQRVSFTTERGESKKPPRALRTTKEKLRLKGFVYFVPLVVTVRRTHYSSR